MQYYSSLSENLYRYAVHIDERSLKYINNQKRELVDIAIYQLHQKKENRLLEFKKNIFYFISYKWRIMIRQIVAQS